MSDRPKDIAKKRRHDPGWNGMRSTKVKDNGDTEIVGFVPMRKRDCPHLWREKQ